MTGASRKHDGSAAAPRGLEAPDVTGACVGEVIRRHGNLVERRTIRVERVIDSSVDLAVADRLGYLWTGRMHRQTAVVGHDGWYHLVELSEPLARAQVEALEGARPRASEVDLLSIIDGRGVLPVFPVAADRGVGR